MKSIKNWSAVQQLCATMAALAIAGASGVGAMALGSNNDGSPATSHEASSRRVQAVNAAAQLENPGDAAEESAAAPQAGPAPASKEASAQPPSAPATSAKPASRPSSQTTASPGSNVQAQAPPVTFSCDWLQPGQYSVKVALQVNGGITDSGPAYGPSEQVETISFLVTAPNAQPGATEQVACPAEITVQVSQSVQITCTVTTPDFRGDMLVYTRPNENLPLEGNYFRFDMSQGPATFTVSLPGDHFAQPGRVVHRVNVFPDGTYADGTLQLRYIDLVINVVEPPAA